MMLIEVNKSSEVYPMTVNLAQVVCFAPRGHAVVASLSNKEKIELGVYDTAERAAEVHADIIRRHLEFMGEGVSDDDGCECPWAFDPPKRFIMPEE